MAIWTVETWRVAPSREDHFLAHCAGLNPERLVLYRDTEEEGLFWSPAKWEDLDALKRWQDSEEYRSVLRVLEDDVVDHRVHVMTEVTDPPRSSASDGPAGPGAPTR